MIAKARGVLGGSAHVSGTRIAVWTIENYRRLGATDSEILSTYPSLSAASLLAAWDYIAHNPEEIERDIRENACELTD